MSRKHPSLLDPAFKYRSAVDTDIRSTFERLCPGWRTRKVSLPGNRTVVALMPRNKKEAK